MVEISNINNKDSLREWLNTQSREVGTTIAHRAAMRVAPFFWESVRPVSSESDLTAQQISRSLLISGVAGVCPTPEIREASAASAADSAASAAYSDSASASAASAYSASAASAYSDSASAASAASAYSAAASAAYSDSAYSASAYSAAAAAWSKVRNDCEELAGKETGQAVYTQSLWTEGDPPFAKEWDKTRTAWQAAGSGWQFWIDWYEDALAGRPPNWDMLTDIALIPNDDWNAGPERVNGLIEGIVGRYRVDQVIHNNPYALHVEVEAKSRKLISFPSDTPDLSKIIRTLRSALRDFNARCKSDDSHNKVGEEIARVCNPVMKDLRRDIGRYKENPLALFEAITDAQNELTSLVEKEGLGAESVIDRLLGNLQRQREDICVASPDVLETERSRSAVRFALYSQGQIDLAIRVCSGMKDDSKGLLQVSAARAMQILSDPASSDEEKRNAWYFIIAVVPRGAKALKEFEEKAEPAPKPKKGRLGQAVDLADSAVKLDKGVDALQEAVKEATPWVTEVYTQIVSGNFWS